MQEVSWWHMAFVNLKPPSPVQQGDLLMRKKNSGSGWHYGTGLSNGLVKDNTPELGKHITTWDGFAAGKPALIIRRERSALENAFVEARTLSNLGDPYDAAVDNCEHDANFSQTGVAVSPTADFWGAVTVVGLSLFGLKMLSDANRPKRRRRR